MRSPGQAGPAPGMWRSSASPRTPSRSGRCPSARRPGAPTAPSTRWLGLEGPAGESEDAGDERFRLAVEAVFADGLLALVPGAESEPLVAVEALQEVAQQRHPDLDSALARPWHGPPEQDRFDEGPRVGHDLHRAPGAGRRGDVRLEPGLLPAGAAWHPGRRGSRT